MGTSFPSSTDTTNTAIMVDWNKLNPFSKRESHSSTSVTTYKVLTLITWVLSVVVSVYYTVHSPHDGHTIRKRIWDQNSLYPSAFSMNSVIASIYWIVSSSCREATLAIFSPRM